MKSAHLSWRYRRRRTPQQSREFSAAQSRRARKRWEVCRPDEPPRETRVIEITIRDSHRPMQIIRATQLQGDEGRGGRLRIDGIQARPVGRRGLGVIVAEAVL